MITLPGYTVDVLLYESKNSRIYRGRRLVDGLPIIFKVLNEDIPSPEKRARFQQEYQLMRKIQSDAILAAHACESHQGLQVLILEDFGGTSVNHLDFCATLLMHQWLELAVNIAHALAELHRHHIMHKDINPANIVWNCDKGQVKLIDLGIATELTREVPEIRHPDRMEGTLAYLSPEQTGRMNRSLDYRTDFYSLGATFYELLTGRLPFPAGDALEMVHAHIARQPLPVEQIRPGVPAMVAAIIAKLMGKTAEERYQSATGLQADLQTCLEKLDARGAIAPFELGRTDFSGRLHISQKLYGRDTQISTLLETYRRVSHGPAELLLVAGYSGVGKSALVHEIQKPITHNRGRFIEGKFDQFKRDIPYASIVQAFTELVQQLLTNGTTVVASWKERLLQSLGNNTQVIIDVIPDLEKIVGKQAAIIELPAAQAQNRFNHEFRKFVAVFATADSPLVLFLDDLQWADLPSLQLMSLLLRSPALPHLLLIGAYRDNEITPAHALQLTLLEMQQAGATIHTVKLLPLDLADVTQLLIDTFTPTAAPIPLLAQLCLTKTDGNPFFLNQFLGALVYEGTVRPEPAQGGWYWHIADVQRADITDNIIELLVAKLHRLPLPTQRLLQGAACLGNTFDLKMLAVVCGLPEPETARQLWIAMQEDLFVPLDDYYKYADQASSASENTLLPMYRFLHDRVHQAAYSLCDDAEKAALHLAIGRLWLTVYSEEKQQNLLFDLVNHLDRGRSLIADVDERLRLAQINLTAARRAKASVAYKPALIYLQTALELVSEDTWATQYSLMFSLHLEAAEAAYLTSDMTKMESTINAALHHVGNVVERAKLHGICIQAYISESRFSDAVVMGLKTLAMLGKSFPENSTRKHALKSLQQMQKVFVGRSVESLALLPDRTDPLQLIISDISLKTCAAAYYAKPEYVPQLMLMGMRQALQYGNGPTNAASYAFYGVVLLGPSGQIDEAAKFGELALKLLERPKMAIYRCRTTWTVHGLLWPWKKPLNESLAPLAQGYLFGLEMGDLEFAANDAMLHAYYTLYSGLPLAELEVQLSAYCNAIAQMQRPSILNAVKILWQAVQNLRGDGAEPAVLQGDICSAERMRELLLRSDDRTFMCKLYGTKLMLAYLFGDYEEASQYAMLTERYTDSISGFFGIGVSCFFDALSRLALLPAMPFHKRFAAFRKIADNQKKLRQWADHAPSNFLHKWYLVEAEVAHYRGKVTKANRAYDEAIRAARRYNFVHEEAIACERAAEHYLSQGIESVAMAYLQQAQHCYRRWGALAKVQKLAERYPQWLSEQDAVWSASTQTTGPTFATSGGDTRMLDFVAMMRASQALSQEIVLEHLLKRLMNVAVESAGAQRGLLLLKKESDWFIEAEKLEVQHVAAVLHQIISDPSDQLNLRLPISLFHYVINTKKSVVIYDAASDKLAANDDYVQHHQPRSILIVPILRQSEISGMLYLENNSISGAFSERRLEVLHVLASQAAIAIDNAYLYADMEERIAARTVELNAVS